MKIKYLSLLLLSCLSLMSVACGQTDNKTQSNENKSTANATEQAKSAQSKEIELPSGMKVAEYEMNPDESILLLTVNSDGQVSYQDKPLDDSALKNVLAEYNEKHKNDPSTTGSKYPSLDDDKYKAFYLKADAGASFTQILKVLKAVQESSPTSYIAKFIVKPLEEVREVPESEKHLFQTYRTPNGRYIVKIDLGTPPKTDVVPKPNPLTLVAKLDAAGKVSLNNDSPMEISELKERLTKLFKEREQNGVFVEGTNEIEKRITLRALPDVKYGDVIKFIDELDGINARPIEFIELTDKDLPVLNTAMPEEQKARPNGTFKTGGSGNGVGTGRGGGSIVASPPPPAPKKNKNN